MNLVNIFPAVIIVMQLVVVWLVWKNRSTSKSDQLDSDYITSTISLGLAQQQTKLFQELSNTLHTSQHQQQESIHTSTEIIQSRFGEIQLKNQQQLQEIQNQLNLTMRSALEQMVISTKQELVSIQSLTKSSLDTISKTNQDKLSHIQGEIEKKLNENLTQNLQSFENVTKNLSQMQSTAGRMIDSTKSIDKLNSIFERTSAKAFGDFGEKYLESVLDQHLDRQRWNKQVTIPGSSERIDFVLSIGTRNVGIDCKFPVTTYHDYLDADSETKIEKRKLFVSSIKSMIQDISTKYLKTEFLDSLLLYVPSDGMYAEIVHDESILKFLHTYKVTLTSPATLFPIIMLINEYHFKQQINDHASEIIDGLSKIKKNVLGFREEFRKLGDKLRQAQTNYDTADRSLLLVHNTIDRLEVTPEPSHIEKIEKKID